MNFPSTNKAQAIAVDPKARHPLPFPLENLSQDIATAYANIDGILNKVNASLSNPVNGSPARQKHIKSILYKTKTCKELLETINKQCEQLWY
ncbi:MAG: hypothetical protein EBW87_02370 [Burkholderiaceae bacterium]|nr:hypothetical protein [Burkholderiaceae bacterium]